MGSENLMWLYHFHAYITIWHMTVDHQADRRGGRLATPPGKDLAGHQ